MSDREIDRQLVERAQQGDKKALGLLVEKYQRKLARLLSRFIRDPAEVEDVTQEAFIKAYRALPAFRGDSAFYTWLYRIGIYTAKNYLMALGRLRELEGMSYEDIAQAMDCPIGTVRSRIFRAREAIAEQLRPLLGTSKDKRW